MSSTCYLASSLWPTVSGWTSAQNTPTPAAQKAWLWTRKVYILGHQICPELEPAEGRVLPENSKVQPLCRIMIIKAWFRLAALESKKESDCITKYIIDQYDDDGSIQYAIGEILFKVYSITLGVLMTVRWFVQQKFAGIFVLAKVGRNICTVYL